MSQLEKMDEKNIIKGLEFYTFISDKKQITKANFMWNIV